jgi:hypothetical protein
MGTVKQTAFRFTAEDLAILGAIQKHTGISSRIDALRAVLRQYVRTERIKVEGPKRKPRP